MANSENTRQKSHSKDDEIDLRQIWDVLSFNKYKIIASGGVGLLLAVAYALLASPVYEANALVQIESNKQNNILGDAQALLGGGGGLNLMLRLIWLVHVWCWDALLMK